MVVDGGKASVYDGPDRSVKYFTAVFGDAHKAALELGNLIVDVEKFIRSVGHLGGGEVLVQVSHHIVKGALAAAVFGGGNIGVDAGCNLLLGEFAILIGGDVFQYHLAGTLEPFAVLSVPTLDTDVDDVVRECYDAMHGVFVVWNTNLTIYM